MLFSFPPLSYMLKFSGSSCLIGGPNESWVECATGTCDAAAALTCRTWRVESRVAEATRRQQLCAAKAEEVSFTRFGALGALAPEHAESARRSLRVVRAGGGTGEWCQQTLRQACSQEFPGSARCVQSFDDSLDSASRKTYRISLRSSSLWEPRHPSLKVLQR